MLQCAHCGAKEVYWQSDFTFEDCGHPGNGLVQTFQCYNCGAWIEYWVSYDEEESAEEEVRDKDD